MEYKVIEGGGITSPKGFTAGAVYVGVKSRKSQKPDVAVLYSETEASCAAVFTTNKFCAAPVILDREILKNGKARAIVINSGNANAATGTQGIEDARTVEREAEKLLGVELGAYARDVPGEHLALLYQHCADYMLNALGQELRAACSIVLLYRADFVLAVFALGEIIVARLLLG